MTRLFLFSNEPFAAAGLRAAVKEHQRFDLVGVYDGQEALCARLRHGDADLLIVQATPDIGLADLNEFRHLAPRLPLVLWVDGVTVEFASQLLAVGVRGILPRSLPLETQLECFTRVAAGELWVEKHLTDRLLCSRQVPLSPRERQLVGLLAQGLKNKEIAETLGLATGSVKVYLSRLFSKVGANDRFDLALYAWKNFCTHPESTPRAGGRPAATAPSFVPKFVAFERANGELRW